MRLYYRLIQETGGWVAASEPVEAYGRGATRAEALSDLRRLLAERFARPEAVAPPANPVPVEIELLSVDDDPLQINDDDERRRVQQAS
jgi:hypothetical protein